MKSRKQGFTLVEIMIVVAIIGLLAAIAIPSFQRSRDLTRANACINNLRLIDAAKEQLALAENLGQGSTDFTEAQVEAYLRAAPVCRAGGNYDYQPIGTDPTCDYVDPNFPHVLDRGGS